MPKSSARVRGNVVKLAITKSHALLIILCIFTRHAQIKEQPKRWCTTIFSSVMQNIIRPTNLISLHSGPTLTHLSTKFSAAFSPNNLGVNASPNLQLPPRKCLMDKRHWRRNVRRRFLNTYVMTHLRTVCNLQRSHDCWMHNSMAAARYLHPIYIRRF